MLQKSGPCNATKSTTENNNQYSEDLIPDFLIKRINFAGITPGIGIKSGYSVYTNKYYKWNLTEIIPFIRLDYTVSEKIDMFLDLGTALSIEHSVERISYGEIGMYRKYLPELKLGLNFRL